jgi:3-deoxy-D-manno-octulosonic-acid transferase
MPEMESFAEKGKLMLIAGSSWPEDEEIIIPYFNAHPEVKLIIAPHEIHREHLLYIQSLLNRPSIRLSESNEESLRANDCLIIDSFGLLSSIYRYGDVAYIGGGFGGGIHNTLEAAVYGIPVVFGPGYHKFKEAENLINCGGGFSVNSETAFADRVNSFISDPASRRRAGAAAGDFVDKNAGATEKILSYFTSA